MAVDPNKAGNGGVPSKQSDYLNATDTAGRPMALVSMILIVLLLAALTLVALSAASWAYNKITSDDGQTSSDVATNDNSNDKDGATDDQDGTTSTSSGENQGSGASQSGTTGSSSSDSSSTTAPNGTIPDTGAGSLLGVFAVTSVAGSVLYQIALRRKYQ